MARNHFDSVLSSVVIRAGAALVVLIYGAVNSAACFSAVALSGRGPVLVPIQEKSTRQDWLLQSIRPSSRLVDVSYGSGCLALSMVRGNYP
jgi:hypothetical protein